MALQKADAARVRGHRGGLLPLRPGSHSAGCLAGPFGCRSLRLLVVGGCSGAAARGRVPKGRLPRATPWFGLCGGGLLTWRYLRRFPGLVGRPRVAVGAWRGSGFRASCCVLLRPGRKFGLGSGLSRVRRALVRCGGWLWSRIVTRTSAYWRACRVFGRGVPASASSVTLKRPALAGRALQPRIRFSGHYPGFVLATWMARIRPVDAIRRRSRRPGFSPKWTESGRKWT